MADYAVTDSRSDEYRDRAQDFFNSWGLDRSRPEEWTGSRDHFSEDDKDLFLRGDHLPGSMQNDEGFYMGRQTRDLSKMNEDEYYTGAQRDQVKQAMTELGMDENDSELKSGRVLSHMFQKHMDSIPVPRNTDIGYSAHITDAKNRANDWINTNDTEQTDYSNTIFRPDSTQAKYDFSDDRFVTDYNKQPEPADDQETTTEAADELLDSYKKTIASSPGIISGHI